LPDEEFIEAVQAAYNHPYLRNADPDVIELLLPALRADMEMYETYADHPGALLACPVSVFVGRDDPLARPDLRAWTEHTLNPPRLTEFAGGHFYLHESESAVIREVRHLLLSGRRANGRVAPDGLSVDK
jgi:surfactin synthase thioesterase subunit